MVSLKKEKWKKRQNEANQIVNNKHKLKFLCKKEAPI